MKNIFLLLIVSGIFISCNTAKQTVGEPTREDSTVLRPPEGYGNPRFARPSYYVDSMKRLMLSAKPVPCQQINGLVATSIGQTSISVFWTSTGAKQYSVYINTLGSKGGSNAGKPIANSFTITSYNSAPLQPGTTYYISVAMIGQGNKICDICDPIKVTTLVTPPPPPPPPPSTGNQVIFLQFDADTVKNTSWNTSGDIISPGSGLTTDERQAILAYVKNIYWEFPQIIFTTDRAIYDAADKSYSQKVIFNIDSKFYCGSDVPCVGGVSYVGSFNTNTPNWVFTAALNYNVRNIAIAAAHECGHATGLHHAVDSCGQSYGFYVLCNDGIRRSKIMGAAYTDYEKFFQNATKCSGWGIPCLQAGSNPCPCPDEPGIIKSHLK